jgi:O-methyltransferase
VTIEPRKCQFGAAAAKKLIDRLGRSSLALIIGVVGPRRIFHFIKNVDPNCVGSYGSSDYAKHLRDAAFLEISKAADSYTLCDVLRRHELWSLVRQTGKLAPGDYLEVGVWRGGTGLVIAEATRRFQTGGRVFLADTFKGVVKASDADLFYSGGEHADTSEAIVRELLRQHGYDNVTVLKGIFPEETHASVDGPLRLVHVDVDVYQSAKDIVEWCFDRLVQGGVIVFDDYGFLGTTGVTRLCEEYEQDPRFMFIHNINGHCILFKRYGHQQGDVPS